MTNRLSRTWMMGVLLMVPFIVPVISQHKVKRQLNSESYQTYTSVPKTSFSCDLRGPGYYADMETQCQVFHICHSGTMDSFICPAGTAFNQKVFVCDWLANVDCAISPEYYSLNSRIGSEEHFLTSPVGSPAARTADGSTLQRAGGSTTQAKSGSVSVTAGSSVENRDRIGTISIDQPGTDKVDFPVGQLGSQSQARVKTIKPDIAREKPDSAGITTSKIGFSNTLLPNTLFVEETTFVTKEANLPDTSESPADGSTKPVDTSSSRQTILSRRKNLKAGKSAGQATRLRAQGYLPASISEELENTTTDKRNEYLPSEGSGEVPSTSERNGYLPLGESDEKPAVGESNTYLPEKKLNEAQSSRTRGSYLPEGRPSYLPEEGEDQRATVEDTRSELNTPSKTPQQADIPDSSFLLPPPPSLEIPNGIEGAFVPPAVDEYSPVATTTAAPPLPPMNLLPLSNEPAPSTVADQLPSTTESYGVLDEEGSEAATAESPSTSPSSRQILDREPRPELTVSVQDNDTIRDMQTSAGEPVTEAAQQFQYNFAAVARGLRDRLRDIEPFDVPAASAAPSDDATAAPSSEAAQGSGVAPSPWLYSLVSVRN